MELGVGVDVAKVMARGDKEFSPVYPLMLKLKSSARPLLRFSNVASRDCSCKATVGDSSNMEAIEKVMSSDHSLDFKPSSSFPLSPLDDLHWAKVRELAPFLTDCGLIRFQVLVEIKWLLKLSQSPEISEVPSLSNEAETYLQDLIDGFGMDDALEVQKNESRTNHDVEAVVYFLKQKCQSHPEISKVLQFFHFLCTSEDIDNLAHALRLKEAVHCVILPVMDQLISAISDMAVENAGVPMLSRTWGQPATTLGKEMEAFACRLTWQRLKISDIKMLGKFAGAAGNCTVTSLAEEFVTSLGISFDPHVTPMDCMTGLFYSVILFNNILNDFVCAWRYAFSGRMTRAGDIGSSTMAHPIDFENCVKSLEIANRGLYQLSTVTRWQGDLIKPIVLENTGVDLGHSLVAYKMALEGISKLRETGPIKV